MTSGMDRDALLRRFEVLLDSALTSEAPPGGVSVEILSSVMEGREEDTLRCDSYALWAAMTALTQEIKLQGRAFQELSHTLSGQTAKIAEELRAVYAERERSLQREAERRCRREALGALIDLRDRLVRGRESVRASNMASPSPAWWRAFAPFALLGKRTPDPTVGVVDALIRGYELGIERLDQTLEEFQAQGIRCQGESFDPRRMNAVASEESGAVPGGTVLEVYRSGYEWNGEIFRPAEVKVSRAPMNPQQ